MFVGGRAATADFEAGRASGREFLEEEAALDGREGENCNLETARCDW